MKLYSRILLKLSGESLMGDQSYGISPSRLEYYARQIKELTEMDIETGIVIGGGNIFRGLEGSKHGYDRYHGDQMGMLATVINGLAIQSGLDALNIRSVVFSAIPMEPVCTYYSQPKALKSLSNGDVCIFTFGTGNPYFTTDTAAALRAVEIHADVLIKGTRVDGVYNDDPEKNPAAMKFDQLSFEEAYRRNLKIMDLTAFTLCRENNLPIIVFDVNRPGNLRKIILGEKVGTIVKN
jgi:uridylate kinase